MADGWTDNSHRSLINFMVDCPKGVCFVKSNDVSDVVKDVGTLLKMFEEVALWIGPNSIVHFVSNNGSNYKVAGRMLSEKYLSITWSPCVAHSINLVLKDIAEMDHIVYLVRRASEGWKEIVRPSVTCFATTFIAMRSLHEHKHDLQAMVTNKSFVDSRYAKRYVYDDMYRAKNAIKKLFKNKKRLYKLYTQIINLRWDRMLHRDIHVVAYYMNHAFKYDETSFCVKPEVMSGFLDTINSKASAFNLNKTRLMEESRLYSNREESFSHGLALETAKTTRPSF
ncbi:uncharacterized protein LOC116131499 [Pistacia vera]|uniref:uncharacterized protein LOC116131499 n=1 Tax=Pistacia vera TaxID=55513 RepID=UPI001262D283|nr:uncharacterized protein LOC116131499 [Pistacia vera]